MTPPRARRSHDALRVVSTVKRYDDLLVLECEHRGDRAVAKLCRDGDRERREQLLNELASYQRLQSPGCPYVLRLLRAVGARNFAWSPPPQPPEAVFGLLLERARGRSLRRFLEVAAARPDLYDAYELLAVLLQVTAAVAYLHAAGVVHNDLHHGNVFVCLESRNGAFSGDAELRNHRVDAGGGFVYGFQSRYRALVYDFDWSSRVPPDAQSLDDGDVCRTSGQCGRNRVALTDEYHLWAPLADSPHPEVADAARYFVPAPALLANAGRARWHTLCFPQQPKDGPLSRETCARCQPRTPAEVRRAEDALRDPHGPFARFLPGGDDYHGGDFYHYDVRLPQREHVSAALVDRELPPCA